MKIIREDTATKLQSLSPGDVFTWDHRTWILVNPGGLLKQGNCLYAVNLESGTMGKIYDRCPVIKHSNAEVNLVGRPVGVRNAV